MTAAYPCGDVPCSLCGAYHITLQCPSAIAGPTWPGWTLQPLDSICALCGTARTCMYCNPPKQWTAFELKPYDCIFCGQKGISPLVYHDCKGGTLISALSPEPDAELEAMYDADSGDS